MKAEALGREALEAQIRAKQQQGDLQAAATLAVEGYGPEVLGYLHAVARNETDADEAFSVFCEALWKGIAAFRWESSFRTWGYSLARHALSAVHRDRFRRRDGFVPLSQAREVAQLAERVRTATRPFLRSAARDRLARLRSQLSSEEKTLIVLRINRRLSWNDIAQIMSDGAQATEPQLKREVAALRKRFQRTKDKLRALSQSEPEPS